MIRRSEIVKYDIPKEALAFADGLCDELRCGHRFWELREGRNDRLTPGERFVCLCLLEKLTARYHWALIQVARSLNMSHGSFYGAMMKQARAIFTMYPDLRDAVINADGYEAARLIYYHWDVAVRAACGETELRASG